MRKTINANENNNSDNVNANNFWPHQCKSDQQQCETFLTTSMRKTTNTNAETVQPLNDRSCIATCYGEIHMDKHLLYNQINRHACALVDKHAKQSQCAAHATCARADTRDRKTRQTALCVCDMPNARARAMQTTRATI